MCVRVSVCCLLVSFSDLIGLTSCNWHDPPTSALLRWFSQQPSSGGGGLDVVIGIRQFAEGRGPKNEGHHLGHRLSPGGCRMMGKAPVTWQWIPTPSFIILQYIDYRMIVDIVCWCVFDCLNCDHMWIYVVILQRWGPNLAKLWSHSNALHLTFAASAWAARKCDVNLRERLSAMHLPRIKMLNSKDLVISVTQLLGTPRKITSWKSSEESLFETTITWRKWQMFERHIT